MSVQNWRTNVKEKTNLKTIILNGLFALFAFVRVLDKEAACLLEISDSVYKKDLTFLQKHCKVIFTKYLSGFGNG
jgi:hypothetical protein